ncbi:MAG: hypothetical protein ED557_10960 [Balneola sp.]|nr:MAG: hypothetical protein ED557_10960 [Balneola sp.]
MRPKYGNTLYQVLDWTLIFLLYILLPVAELQYMFHLLQQYIDPKKVLEKFPILENETVLTIVIAPIVIVVVLAVYRVNIELHFKIINCAYKYLKE